MMTTVPLGISWIYGLVLCVRVLLGANRLVRKHFAQSAHLYWVKQLPKLRTYYTFSRSTPNL